jgi:hypothetical protein
MEPSFVTSMGVIMKITLFVGLAYAIFLISTPAQAAGASGEACRAAVAQKGLCRSERLNSPGKKACFKSAMQRCKAQGIGAI